MNNNITRHYNNILYFHKNEENKVFVPFIQILMYIQCNVCMNDTEKCVHENVF